VPGGGLCAARRPRDLWRRGSQAHRHPCGLGVSCRRPRAQGQARGALSLSRLFDPREARERLRGGASDQSVVRPRDLPPRGGDYARGGRRAQARRRRHGGGVGGRNAPLRRERDARPVGGGQDRCGAVRRARPRGGGASRPRRRGRSRALDRGAGRLYRAKRRRVPGPARAFSARRGRATDDEEPRRPRPHPSAHRRARPSRAGSASARRPSSRQHRAPRRPAGRIRRHRVQCVGRIR